MGRSVQITFQTGNNINGTTNFSNLIQGFFTFTCYGLTSASPGKSQNSTFCCHSLFRVLRSDCNGELQILLLCKPRKSLVGHAYIVRVGFYNHQQYWKSSTTQKKKNSNSCACCKSSAACVYWRHNIAMTTDYPFSILQRTEIY